MVEEGSGRVVVFRNGRAELLRKRDLTEEETKKPGGGKDREGRSPVR